jgi:hypothetical protein
MSILNVLDRPIAFNRAFVDLGVGITGALMLSQCVYWSTRTKNPDGWFYKTQSEWADETGLTRREQETARKRLIAKGYVVEVRRGVPCKVYYKLNREALEADLWQIAQTRQSSMAESAKLDCTKAPSCDGGKRQTITEITAETTTETSGPNRAKRKTALPDGFKPNETCRSKAIALGVSLEVELDKFTSFHQAKGNKYVDWQAAFRNWLTKAAEFRAQRGSNVSQFPARNHDDDSGSKIYVPAPAKGGAK